jgi:hypothetical protein
MQKQVTFKKQKGQGVIDRSGRALANKYQAPEWT